MHAVFFPLSLFFPPLIKFPTVTDCASRSMGVNSTEASRHIFQIQLQLSKSTRITYMAFNIYACLALGEGNPNLPEN